MEKPVPWSVASNFNLHPDGNRFAVMTPISEERKRDHVTLLVGFGAELERLVPR